MIKLTPHSPGNATRYDLALVPAERGLKLLVLANFSRCALLPPDGLISLSYLSEKLDWKNVADLRAILGWLETQGYETL